MVQLGFPDRRQSGAKFVTQDTSQQSSVDLHDSGLVHLLPADPQCFQIHGGVDVLQGVHLLLCSSGILVRSSGGLGLASRVTRDWLDVWWLRHEVVQGCGNTW